MPLQFCIIKEGLQDEQTAEEELAGLLKRRVLLSTFLQNQACNVVPIGVDTLQLIQEYATSRLLHAGNEGKIAGIGGMGVNYLDIELNDINTNLVSEERSIYNGSVIVALLVWI